MTKELLVAAGVGVAGGVYAFYPAIEEHHKGYGTRDASVSGDRWTFKVF